MANDKQLLDGSKARTAAAPAAPRTGNGGQVPAPKPAPVQTPPAPKPEATQEADEHGEKTELKRSTFVFSGLIAVIEEARYSFQLSNVFGFTGKKALTDGKESWVHLLKKTRLSGAVQVGQKALVIGRSVLYRMPDGAEKWYRYPDICVIGEIDIHEAIKGLADVAHDAQTDSESQAA